MHTHVFSLLIARRPRDREPLEEASPPRSESPVGGEKYGGGERAPLSVFLKGSEK